MFLERKTKASTLEGFKLALRRQTISPALEKIHKKIFFTIRVAQWIRVPGYQNGYPGSGIHSGTRVPVPSSSILSSAAFSDEISIVELFYI
jgi:hypothetical protein